MELRARRLAARRMIPLGALAEALIGATYGDEVADRFDVDPDLVNIRIRELSDEDRVALFSWSRALTMERFDNGADVMS